MNLYERFFAQHKTFVLKIAIFFIYLLIIYPACPARGKKSDDSTCTSHRFFFCLCYRRPNHLNALRFTLGIFSGKIFLYLQIRNDCGHS